MPSDFVSRTALVIRVPNLATGSVEAQPGRPAAAVGSDAISQMLVNDPKVCPVAGSKPQ